MSDSHVSFDPKSKARYWWALMYLENMRPDWESFIAELFQLPFAYCIHNQDANYSDGSLRKPHVHIIIAFPNTTTGKNALSVFQRLNADGKNAILGSQIEKITNIGYAYNYLIHDTDTARAKGKFLYPSSARITGNNFDIGAFEQLSSSDLRTILLSLADSIVSEEFTNFTDFFQFVRISPDFAGYRSDALEISWKYSGFFERLCRGNYLKKKANINELQSDLHKKLKK